MAVSNWSNRLVYYSHNADEQPGYGHVLVFSRHIHRAQLRCSELDEESNVVTSVHPHTVVTSVHPHTFVISLMCLGCSKHMCHIQILLPPLWQFRSHFFQFSQLHKHTGRRVYLLTGAEVVFEYVFPPQTLVRTNALNSNLLA